MVSCGYADILGPWNSRIPNEMKKNFKRSNTAFVTDLNLYQIPITTSPLQSNLGTARCSHTTMQQSPHWLQWDIPNSPPKLPLPLQRSPPPCNKLIPQPTPLTIPNGIRIQSAILPQYTFQTDLQTDRLTDTDTDRQMG